jgi:hypothetical protein
VVDGRLAHVVGGQDVVAVGLQPQHTVADRLVDEVFRGRLLVRGGGVGVPVVLDHDDQRALLHGGEVDAQKDKAAGDEWSFHDCRRI